MHIPQRVTEFLDNHQIEYKLVEHQHSYSSIGSALTSQIPYEQLAKAVLLEDHEDRKLMAILPANRKVSLSKVNEECNGSYHLVKESKIYEMFADCDHGAVPPLAEAYHVDLIYDDVLMQTGTVYMESGDHETLLEMEHDAFVKLMGNAKHHRFSHEFLH